MAEAEQLSFAALLRRYRRAAGLTQEALAERAGVSARAVSDLERGLYRAPHRDTVDLLGRALDLSPAQRGFLERAVDRRRALPPAVEAEPAPTRGGLPVPLTSLIGREALAEQVADLLHQQGARLVTLSGPAGVGKTRLALHVAGAARPRFPDGVVFVPLDAVTDPDLVLPAIAAAAGAGEAGPGGSPGDAIVEALQPRRALLVLDNFEQVLPAAPQVATVLSGCPRLTVLVTSRAALRVRGERLLPVPPLAGPDAVALFLQRARETAPDLDPADDETDTIEAICARLDGLPLAIELAAARARLLGPSGVLARLVDPLTLLTGGPRDLPERHQALRTAVAWSYDLLSPDERAVFRRLAVFAGGCTVEAATTVCALPEAPPLEHEPLEHDPLDALGALVDHSLLRREGRPGAPRLRLLETLREFSALALVASGEQRAAERAHAGYFLALAERAARELIGPTLELWLDRLQAEHDNLRKAMRWAVDQEETAVALRLGAALGRFWSLRGHVREGWRWLETALALPLPDSVSARERAQAVNAAGVLAQAANEYRRADVLFEEGLTVARASADAQLIAQALISAGGAARAGGDLPRADALFEEALALPDLSATPRTVARALFNLGMVARDRQEHDRAAGYLRRCRELQVVLGDRHGEAVTLNVLASVHFARGDHAGARALHQEGLAIQEGLGHRRGVAVSLGFMCVEAVSAGDRPAAASLCARALTASREVGERWNTAECLAAIARTAWEDGSPDGAARLLGAAARLRQGSRAPLEQRPLEARLLAEVRATLGDAAFQDSWDTGHALGFEAAVDLGLEAALTHA